MTNSSLQPLEREVLRNCRAYALCVTLDRLGLSAALITGTDRSDHATQRKALAAAELVGVVRHDERGFRWTPEYLALASVPDAWERFLRVILHQTTYIALSDSVGNVPPPSDQAADSAAYLRFLKGVAASHIAHAETFAALQLLETCESLVDLGCGLGTFAQAWINSRTSRTATCVDLPAAINLTRDAVHSSRATFVGANLNEPLNLPAADLYLIANTLHLLPKWRSSLGCIASAMRQDALLAILEADPTTSPGALFDFQVHLRSGCVAGLINPLDIEGALVDFGFSLQTSRSADPSDPFERDYILFLAHRESISEEAI